MTEDLETACKIPEINYLNDLSEVRFKGCSINVRNTKLENRKSDYQTARFVCSQAAGGGVDTRTLMYQFGVKTDNDGGHLV